MLRWPRSVCLLQWRLAASSRCTLLIDQFQRQCQRARLMRVAAINLDPQTSGQSKSTGRAYLRSLEARHVASRDYVQTYALILPHLSSLHSGQPSHSRLRSLRIPTVRYRSIARHCSDSCTCLHYADLLCARRHRATGRNLARRYRHAQHHSQKRRYCKETVRKAGKEATRQSAAARGARAVPRRWSGI
jgi:hypothetical protein